MLPVMIRKSISTSCLIAFILAGSFALAQTEFSGEVVDCEKGNKAPTKVFFGKDKMRFESQASDSEGRRRHYGFHEPYFSGVDAAAAHVHANARGNDG